MSFSICYYKLKLSLKKNLILLTDSLPATQTLSNLPSLTEIVQCNQDSFIQRTVVENVDNLQPTITSDYVISPSSIFDTTTSSTDLKNCNDDS